METTITGERIGTEEPDTDDTQHGGAILILAASSLEETVYRVMVPRGLMEEVPATAGRKRVTVQARTDWERFQYTMTSIRKAGDSATEGKDGDPPGTARTRFNLHEGNVNPYTRGPADVYEFPCPSCGERYGGVHVAAGSS